MSSAQIVQAGGFNAAAVVVPDLYVNVSQPSPNSLNGAPTNVLGIVGTAIWGPVNLATIAGDVTSAQQSFGTLQNRKYDLMTSVAVAVQQGCSNFRLVRVTDGTDTAATVALGAAFLTLTGKYTGSFGNQISATWGNGTRANTSKLTITAAGATPEVFDNIAGTGNALAVAMAAAVNSGSGVLRGASALVIATAGAGVTAPAVGSVVSLAGGTDGASVTSAMMVGQDVTPRKGIYALRGQGVSVLNVTDLDDSTQWSTVSALALAEGMYFIGAGPSGDTILNAQATKLSAGIDTYSMKLMFGDWVYWSDTANGLIRLVSPASFAAGIMANLTPNNSSLNKALQGVIGTQKSGAPGTSQAATYTQADLASLIGSGIDVIASPSPGGAYFSCRGGVNTSSNSAVNLDSYTRMTNFISATIGGGMGIYVGEPITPDLINDARATMLNTFSNIMGSGLITQFPGGPLPYSVRCDTPAVKNTNNPLARTSLGYLTMDVKVQYQAINQKFIVNLTGGSSVTPDTSAQ